MTEFCRTKSASLLFVFCMLLYACNRKSNETGVNGKTNSGEIVARKYCGTCHAFTTPELLDKETWVNQTLPAMGYRFGIYNNRQRDSLIEGNSAGRLIRQLNIFPVKQTITNEEWFQIVEYYKNNAPEKLDLPPETSAGGTSPFQVVIPQFKIERPAVSAITYDERSGMLYVADCSRENFSSVTMLNRSLKPVTSLGLPYPVSNIALRKDSLYILMMGHFIPSDEPAGQLIKAIKNEKGEYEGYKIVLKGLKRPVDADYSDFDADGDEDVIVCEFGNHTGSVSLFINEGRRYTKTTLMDSPGAIEAVVEDLNNDGRKDIMVLMAQGDEGIDIYLNEGNNRFKRERILRFPPVFGSVSFSLHDFDRDGMKDILYVNGDNADASRIIKPYHGIRIFLNDKKNHFAESYFYSLPGAYGAAAADFDGDKDLDISAISFFPDFHREPTKDLIHLENISTGGGLGFTPSLPEVPPGRWMIMTNADINRDDRMDLLLGSFTSIDIPGDSLSRLKKKIQKQSHPLILLRNHTRD